MAWPLILSLSSPLSNEGTAGYLVAVNSTRTGLVFVPPDALLAGPGGGTNPGTDTNYYVDQINISFNSSTRILSLGLGRSGVSDLPPQTVEIPAGNIVGTGDITAVVAGAGIAGGADSGSAKVSVDLASNSGLGFSGTGDARKLGVIFGGTGSATTVSKSDHNHGPGGSVVFRWGRARSQ